MIHYAEYDGGYGDDVSSHQPEMTQSINYIDEGEAIFLVPVNTKISVEEKIQLARSIPKNTLKKIEGAIGMYMHTFPSHPITVVYYFDRHIIPDALAFMRQSMQDFLIEEDLPKNTIIMSLVV